MTNEVERRADDEPTKIVKENVTKNEEEEPAGVSSSYTVGYYLKHRINEKVIEGLVENQKFNDSLSAAQVVFSTDITNKLRAGNFSLKTKRKSSQCVETASGLNPTASRLQQCEDSKIFKLYLTRRSFEVLRKFHWTILGGRSNQFLALGWHLEDLHVTWAHLEKKRTRLRLYTKNHEELCIQSMEMASPSLSDDVRIFIVTASEI
ncbi:hypothetical protein Tco_0499313 [Tanacetum coccineum]